MLKDEYELAVTHENRRIASESALISLAIGAAVWGGDSAKLFNETLGDLDEK